MVKRKKTERRRHVRCPVFLKGKLHLLPPEGGGAPVAVEATVEDLTPRGARVLLNEAVEPSTLGRLQVGCEGSLACELPGSHCLSVLAGRIVWVDARTDKARPRIGMEFTDLCPEERSRVTIFLQKIAPWVME